MKKLLLSLLIFCQLSAINFLKTSGDTIVDENNKEYVSGRIDVCLIDLMTKKPQRFSDDLLLIFK